MTRFFRMAPVSTKSPVNGCGKAADWDDRPADEEDWADIDERLSGKGGRFKVNVEVSDSEMKKWNTKITLIKLQYPVTLSLNVIT